MKTILYSINAIFIGLFSVFLAGCCGMSTINMVWISDPGIQKIENDYFEAKITPVTNYTGYEGFNLQIKNKTDSNIEIIWVKTFYIKNGKNNDGFMIEGEDNSENNKSVPNDIILAKNTFSKTIWPIILLKWISVHPGGWSHEHMKAGENGIYLTIKADDKEIIEKITINLSYSPASSESPRTPL